MAWKKSKGTQEIHFAFGQIPFAKRIAIMGKEQTMTLIDGDKLADTFKDKLCDHLYCRDCSFQLEDGGCKVEKWLDDAPSIDIVRRKWDTKTEREGE